MGRFSFTATRSPKSPAFWVFLIFRPQLASLSLFLPRANFPDVASDPPNPTSNYQPAGLTAGPESELIGKVPVWKLPLRLSSNHLAAAGTMKEFITEAANGYGRAANRAGYSSAT